MIYTYKERKLMHIGQWLTKFKLEGMKPSFEKMSNKELAAVLSLISTAYGTGGDEARAFRRNYRRDVARWSGKKLPELKIIRGGA